MKKVVALTLTLLALCASAAMAFVAGPGFSPDQALDLLKRGNERFVSGKPIHPNQDAFRRTMTAKEGQKPYAVVLGCADSREPVELIFDAGIGDIFVARVAGNVTYFDQAGSIEYGAEHLGANLVVVLGHTKCGAVNAVVNGDQVHGNIPALVAAIVPPVTRTKAENPTLEKSALAEKAIKANAWQSIEDLFTQSPMMRELVKSGKTKVVGAIYDIHSGKVEWMGEHPSQAQLLELTGGTK